MRAAPLIRSILLAIVLTLLLAGCGGRRATAADCREIFDRLVEVELRERGFQDPALVELKRQELRNQLSSELKECQGKPLKPGALACVRTVKTAEKISHECFR
jgi:hypothetical protein